MGEIYGKARYVWIWLGLANEQSKVAISLIHDINRTFAQFSGNNMVFNELVDAGLPSTQLSDWISLEAFFWRSWFTRVWGIQEIGLSQKALMVCGDDWISAEDFSTAVSFISQSAIQQATGLNIGSASLLTQLYSARATGDSRSLLRLLFDSREHQATDKRDKIYALLGLCNKLDVQNVEPDYNQTVCETYRLLAVNYLKQGTLDILTAVSDSFWRGRPYLPSWVPDWSITNRLTEFLRPSQEISAHATAKSVADARFSDDGNILILEGMELDSIAHTYKPYLFRSLDERIDAGFWQVSFMKAKTGVDALMRAGGRLAYWQRSALSGLQPRFTKSEALAVFLTTITAGQQIDGPEGSTWKNSTTRIVWSICLRRARERSRQKTCN